MLDCSPTRWVGKLHAYTIRSQLTNCFACPAIPTNEECSRAAATNGHGKRDSQGNELTVLAAARFAEIAHGVLVTRNKVGMSIKLCHAVWTNILFGEWTLFRHSFYRGNAAAATADQQ